MLANSALYIEGLRGPTETLEASPTALHYHQLAVSSVRLQLEESHGRPNEEILACVSAFLGWAVSVRS